jgi:aminopeptidase N
VDWLPDARAFQDRPWFPYILVPHELAHQWFGDYVTTEDWANMWLNEGFAEFMPGQYWFTKLGARAEDEYYADEYAQFMAIDAGRRMPLASLGSNNIYPKGALVVRMLQRHLGRERFWASVNRYLVRRAYGPANTEQFREAVLEATGENMTWFWDQWLYQAGYPEFVVRARYDSAARRLTLAVRQVQVDTGAARTRGGAGGGGADSTARYTTPAVFRAPMTVRVGTAAGDVVRRVVVDRREQDVVVDGVAGEPTMVVFDDGNAVLKTLDFEQPTRWLVAQLGRDADLWNRQWVIGQLAEKGDAEAFAALAAAARSADYFSTRAEAAAALARFDAARAVPALVPVLRDTSSAVRAAALGSLGQLGGPEAARLARAAFEADPSYEARAAALLAAATADPAGRTALVARGLRTPSYRDAIATAALQAVVRTADAASLGAVEGALGEQQGAAAALAAFAARGSRPALDALVRHFDDDRAWVRRGVAQALRRSVPRPVVGAALTPVAARFRYPDAAAAARELMADAGSAR